MLGTILSSYCMNLLNSVSNDKVGIMLNQTINGSKLIIENKYFMNFKNALGSIFLFLLICLTGCQKDDDPIEGEKTLAGFLYTTTNGESTNQVLKLDRYSDGSVGNEVAYSTNSLGGANTSVGGDARGDFDSQGAIQIIGDYLLNVNAGGNTVSIFSIDRPTGELSLKNNVDSGGTRPTSITYTPKSGSSTEYWVVVGNQWNNPNVQKDGDNIERYPDDAWHMEDLTQSDDSDDERNITLFSFNASTGELTMDQRLDTYVRKNGGPTTVAFSDDGSKLAVATWGIAHFGTSMTSTDEQHPSRVYVYDFSNGTVSSEKRYFEEEGIAGTIGFNWAKGSNSILHVSNFNLIPSKRNNSLTILTDSDGIVAKTGNYNTVEVDDIDEACWTLLNPAGDVLYVSSFGANAITTFNVSVNGTISSEGTFEVRGGTAPAGDTKDMYVTPDNKYLYNIGAFQSFSMNTFEISGSSLSYKDQYTYSTTSVSVGSVGTYNFLGLVGYSL